MSKYGVRYDISVLSVGPPPPVSTPTILPVLSRTIDPESPGSENLVWSLLYLNTAISVDVSLKP